MSKRSETFQEDNLNRLYTNHPYLLLFQKEDWKEYLTLLAQIYDVLEEESTRIPFEVLRAFTVKFFSQRNLQSVEGKVQVFFNMAIAELSVLRDSHDQFGQRFIETTRSGKELLRLTEDLLNQRVKFSGTGAETLLGALNNILSSRQKLTESEAIEHHRQKIKSYQNDILKIQQKGLSHAELLPIPHSNEALFSQAEEAALHILSSIEDVKLAIENQRQDLARSYLEHSRNAGENLSLVAEFYEALHHSTEYSSYSQAKQLLSFLEGFAARFSIRNVDQLLYQITHKDLIPSDEVQKSHLRGFMSQFLHADEAIQNTIKSQIKLLQQQVHYALSTDAQGVRFKLREILSLFMSNKERVFSFLETSPLELKIPAEFDLGITTLSDLTVSSEHQNTQILHMDLEENERIAMFEALLQAEETTLQEVLHHFLKWLRGEKKAQSLKDYPIRWGLAEYYVLCEIELFAPIVQKKSIGHENLLLQTKSGDFILRNADIYEFKIGVVDGVN